MAEQSNTPRGNAPAPGATDSASRESTARRETPAHAETESSRSLAIALSSKGGRAQATQVTAKGTGEVAEQILHLAFEHGVKVRTDADLATILSAVEVESEIPLEALTAVANILSYIYRAENPSSPESKP